MVALSPTLGHSLIKMTEALVVPYRGCQRVFSFCSSRRSCAGTARPESLRTKSNVGLGPLSNHAHRLFHRRYLENGPLEPW